MQAFSPAFPDSSPSTADFFLPLLWWGLQQGWKGCDVWLEDAA